MMTQVGLGAGLVDSDPVPASCVDKEGGTGEGMGRERQRSLEVQPGSVDCPTPPTPPPRLGLEESQKTLS